MKLPKTETLTLAGLIVLLTAFIWLACLAVVSAQQICEQRCQWVGDVWVCEIVCYNA